MGMLTLLSDLRGLRASRVPCENGEQQQQPTAMSAMHVHTVLNHRALLLQKYRNKLYSLSMSLLA
jgi:hypothetical protein